MEERKMMNEIYLEVRSEATREIIKEPFRYISSIMRESVKGNPMLYLVVVSKDGIFSLRKATMCRVLAIDGKRLRHSVSQIRDEDLGIK